MPLAPANLLAAFASAFSQSNRLLKLHFAHGAGIADDTLLPWKLKGSEALNDGYRFELTALSSDAFIELKRLIGQPIAVSILTDQGDYRPLTGWVTQAKAAGSDGGLSRYELVIEDLFAVLNLRVNNRVFQDVTAKDAVLAIVREHLAANPVLAASLTIDDRTTREYPVQSWITQYNESDAAFGKRKLAEEGINYGFDSQWQDGHIVTTLILFDDNAQLPELGTVRFHRADGTEAADSITEWNAHRRLSPASVAAASYDYKPVDVIRTDEATRFDQGEAGDALASTLQDYRHDITHYGNDSDDYARYTTLRMQAHEAAAKQFAGSGSTRQLRAGQRFTLADHPEIDAHDPQDRAFVLTQVAIEAVNNLPEELGKREKGNGKRGEPVFKNTFTASRDTVRLVPEYRATDHAKPAAPQTLNATVVGPAGEEIHTDSLGRIKVNLHFPRPADHAQGGASQNENDSVWIRVSQPWAGTEYGGLFLPRVGDEVSLGFIGGDIDRPVVLHSLYNGTHRPPTFSHAGDLPGNKTLSGIKSKMYKGAGANELVFDDTTNQLRARLATDHGQTALNQGFLVHPRVDGKGTPRGEGFELRTDQSGALRAAKGLLITTDARYKAQGKQLDRQELTSQLDTALEQAKQLGELSNTHHAEGTDTKPQERLLKQIKDWEQGSNTLPSPASGRGAGGEGATGGEGRPGGAPLIALSAPAGMALSTPQMMTLHTSTHADLITGQDANFTQGKNFRSRAKDMVSLFAYKLGMKLIAAAGKIKIEAHSDNIEITAAKKIILTGLENVNFKAPKISYIAQGAGYDIGQGQITSKTTGVHTRHAGKHVLTGPRGVVMELPVVPFSSAEGKDVFSHVFDIGSMLHRDPELDGAPYQIWTKESEPQLLTSGVISNIGRTIRVFTSGPKDLELIVGESEWISVPDDWAGGSEHDGMEGAYE